MSVTDFSDYVKVKGLNWSESGIENNIKTNIRRMLPQVDSYQKQDAVVGLVGGGPSLDPELVKEKAKEMPMISMNGTHDWLLSLDIKPSAHIMLDARPFNARFIRNAQKGTKYLIASQCHPDVFDALEGYDVWIWHGGSGMRDLILDQYYMGRHHEIVGGSTVMLRALTLMVYLGFSRFEVFGFDSCYMGDKHHAYEQAENDGEDLIELKVSGREFVCAPWMFSQAKEFINQTKMIGNLYELVIHGDGLIKHIIESGSIELAEK